MFFKTLNGTSPGFFPNKSHKKLNIYYIHYNLLITNYQEKHDAHCQDLLTDKKQRKLFMTTSN